MFATLLFAAVVSAPRPLLLAHFMPWFQSKPVGGAWGWHWTMAKFDPDRRVDGMPQIASKSHPLIGAYDSSDPDVLECQALLMKLSGFDGLVIDWYGMDDVDDFAQNNRNAELMARAADRVGLRYAVIYEDHILSELIKNSVVKPSEAIEHGRATMRWLGSHWFNRPEYLRRQGRPVFLVFGPQFYRDDDFSAIFAGMTTPPAYFRLLNLKGPAVGGFGWPGPQPGEAKSWQELDAFYTRAKSWPAYIGVAYPRFDDYYAQAGVHPSWGAIADHTGETFRRTLTLALARSPFAVQVATWNDWGEGTQVEPSFEYGYRDLEEIQRAHRRIDPSFAFGASDLRLPVELFRLRKLRRDAPRLDRAAAFLRTGNTREARRLLAKISS